MYNDNRYAADMFIPNMTFVMSSYSLCPYSILPVVLLQLLMLFDLWNRYTDNA